MSKKQKLQPNPLQERAEAWYSQKLAVLGQTPQPLLKRALELIESDSECEKALLDVCALGVLANMSKDQGAFNAATTVGQYIAWSRQYFLMFGPPFKIVEKPTNGTADNIVPLDKPA